MSTDAVVLSLKSLKLHGMAGAVAELAEQGAPAYHQSTGLLNQLIKAEVADREVRSINYQMKVARFPAHRDLSGFSFADSAVNEALVRTLHRCKFLDQSENIVLIGGPGSGKTHLATAIGVEAIVHHHRRVRFLSTVELVNALEQEKHDAKQGRLANRFAHTDLIILAGLLSRHVHINGYGPVAIKSFRKGAFSICDTPGVSVTQVLDSTVVIAPSAAGNGLHLFGDSGALVCEWSGISRPEQPVKLTLAAQTAASWDPPVMGSQWMQYTNDLVTISADIWNPRAKKYERLVANKSFDRSDRLYLGEVQPFYFFEGTIRLRLTIHESLSAQQRGLWLKNLYLHPYPVHRYVNVNTA